MRRTGIWLSLRRLGCLPKFIQMVIQLHEIQCGHIRLKLDLSETFPITNGGKHGCVLALTIFSIIFRMMLKQATDYLDNDDGVYVKCRMDGGNSGACRVPSIEAVPLKYDLLWAGNVSRMEDHRLPKITLHREQSTDHRRTGAPKKRWIDCHKSPSLHVMLTVYHGQTWKLTVMPGAIRSSKRLTSMKKTEKMHKKTREAKGSSSRVICLTGHCFHTWTLPTVLPFQHSLRQTRVCLQTTWIDCLIFFREAKPLLPLHYNIYNITGLLLLLTYFFHATAFRCSSTLCSCTINALFLQ